MNGENVDTCGNFEGEGTNCLSSSQFCIKETYKLEGQKVSSHTCASMATLPDDGGLYSSIHTDISYCLCRLNLMINIPDAYCQQKGNGCHKEKKHTIAGVTWKDIKICCCDTDL